MNKIKKATIEFPIRNIGYLKATINIELEYISGSPNEVYSQYSALLNGLCTYVSERYCCIPDIKVNRELS